MPANIIALPTAESKSAFVKTSKGGSGFASIFGVESKSFQKSNFNIDAKSIFFRILENSMPEGKTEKNKSTDSEKTADNFIFLRKISDKSETPETSIKVGTTLGKEKTRTILKKIDESETPETSIKVGTIRGKEKTRTILKKIDESETPETSIKVGTIRGKEKSGTVLKKIDESETPETSIKVGTSRGKEKTRTVLKKIDESETPETDIKVGTTLGKEKTRTVLKTIEEAENSEKNAEKKEILYRGTPRIIQVKTSNVDEKNSQNEEIGENSPNQHNLFDDDQAFHVQDFLDIDEVDDDETLREKQREVSKMLSELMSGYVENDDDLEADLPDGFEIVDASQEYEDFRDAKKIDLMNKAFYSFDGGYIEEMRAFFISEYEFEGLDENGAKNRFLSELTDFFKSYINPRTISGEEYAKTIEVFEEQIKYLSHYSLEGIFDQLKLLSTSTKLSGADFTAMYAESDAKKPFIPLESAIKPLETPKPDEFLKSKMSEIDSVYYSVDALPFRSEEAVRRVRELKSVLKPENIDNIVSNEYFAKFRAEVKGGDADDMRENVALLRRLRDMAGERRTREKTDAADANAPKIEAKVGIKASKINKDEPILKSEKTPDVRESVKPEKAAEAYEPKKINAEETREYDKIRQESKISRQSPESASNPAPEKDFGEKNSKNSSESLNNIFINKIAKKTASKSAKSEKSSASGEIIKYSDVKAHEIGKTTMKIVKNAQNGALTKARLTLQPRSLGTVFVELQIQGGILNANFRTETKEAAKSVENQLSALKEALSQNGIKYERIEVKNANEDNDLRYFGENNNGNRQPKGEEREERRRFVDSFKRINEDLRKTDNSDFDKHMDEL